MCTGPRVTPGGLHLHVGGYRRKGDLPPPTRGVAYHPPAALVYILRDVLVDGEHQAPNADVVWPEPLGKSIHGQRVPTVCPPVQSGARPGGPRQRCWPTISIPRSIDADARTRNANTDDGLAPPPPFRSECPSVEPFGLLFPPNAFTGSGYGGGERGKYSPARSAAVGQADVLDALRHGGTICEPSPDEG